MGRHRGRGFGGALALEDLRERFPQRPAPGVGFVDLPAVAVAGVEHLAVAEVRVVGDRHRVVRAARGGLQPVPQLFGVGGLVVAQRQVRDVVAAEDDDPVEVDPTGGGRPLEPVQRGEPAGVVVAGGDLHDPPPDRPARVQHLLQLPDGEPGGIGADHAGDDHFHHGVHVAGPAVLAGRPGGAVPVEDRAGRRVLRVVVRVHDEPVLAQPLGVLGDRREVQRAGQPRLLGVVQRGAGGLALGEPEGLIGAVQRRDDERVQRPGGVDVQFPEVGVPQRVRGRAHARVLSACSRR